MLAIKLAFCLASLGLLLPNVLYAQSFYHSHTIGWHWYHDIKMVKIKKAKKEKANKEKVNNGGTLSSNSLATMSALQTYVKKTLYQALLTPSIANVAAYLQLQNQLSHQAHHFSNVWQAVLMANPELNDQLQFPTNAISRKLYYDEHNKQEASALKQLAKHYGLIFFYRSTCPYCRQFAPILKTFIKRYPFTILPITTDGKSLTVFPNSKFDVGLAKAFHVMAEPAVFLVNPKTFKAIPVTYGLVSHDELRQRLVAISRSLLGVSV